MQLVDKPDLYDVLCAAQPTVRHLAAGWRAASASRRAPTSGTQAAVFEPVHRLRLKYAGLDRANPTATAGPGR